MKKSDWSVCQEERAPRGCVRRVQVERTTLVASLPKHTHHDLAVNLVGPTGVVAQATSDAGNVHTGSHGGGLAHVEGLEVGEVLSVGVDELSELPEHLAALGTGGLGPDFVSSLGGLDGGLDIFLAGLLDLADDFTGRGVDGREGLARLGLDELHERRQANWNQRKRYRICLIAKR